MTSQDEYDDYLTNDMAIVAYLKLCGHTPQAIEYQDGECKWRFLILANFLELVESFLNDQAKVNPREYNKCFAQVKRDMYRVLDNQG